MGAAVIQQVELDIPATAYPLPVELAGVERQLLTALNNWEVRRLERLGAAGNDGQQLSRIAVFESIEEDPADASALVAVGQTEVLVAARLEAAVVARVVPVAGLFVDRVEVASVSSNR